MTAFATVVRYAIQEGLRRRVFLVVTVLTVTFVAVYTAGAAAIFGGLDDFAGGQNERAAVGTGLLGFGMFVILFLGTTLAIFLTIGTVRGDAERGLLQPLVVRPLGRTRLLGARLAAAAGMCSGYVVGSFVLLVLLTAAVGGWFPDSVLGAAFGLAGAVLVVCLLSLLGSTFLSATANGIAVFMLFGAGLGAALMYQLAVGLDSGALKGVSEVAGWMLPFMALYLSALGSLGPNVDTADILGGPSGLALVIWTLVYLGLLAAGAREVFLRRDL
jgi:ABC-type transport system involved in multi-copper enzyme maturation permease subunit